MYEFLFESSDSVSPCCSFVGSLSAFWYAWNNCRFDNCFLHFSKAWVFVLRAIFDANKLHGGCMNNFVLNMSILKSLGVEGFRANAIKIIYVIWYAPHPR